VYFTNDTNYVTFSKKDFDNYSKLILIAETLEYKYNISDFYYSFKYSDSSNYVLDCNNITYVEKESLVLQNPELRNKLIQKGGKNYLGYF